MTTHRSKKYSHKKQPHKSTGNRKAALVDYPMQLPITVEFKERLLLFNGCETPISLFKFERPEPARVAAFREGVAYFSLPNGFNDTQDCRLALDGSLSNEELKLALSPENQWLTAGAPPLSANQTNQAAWIEGANAHLSIAYFRTILEEYKRGGRRRIRQRLDLLANLFARPVQTGGICCFTDDWRNELMWEKYARKDSGFVLEFNTQNCAICWDASPIEYVDKFPKIRLYAAAMAGTTWKDMLRVPLTKLRERWWQEREWRTWRMIPGFYRYAPDSLVSVTLGQRIQDDLANCLLAIVASKYFPRTRVYETKFVDGALVRIPIM